MPAPRGRGDRPSGAFARASAQARRTAGCIGVGFSIFCEQAAHGTSVYAGWGIPMVPGHEQATRAPDARRRPRAAGRRAFPRPGARDHARSGRQRDPRHRLRRGQGRAWRHCAHALFDRHLGLALHGDGAAARWRGPARRSPGARRASARTLLQADESEVQSATARWSGRPAASTLARDRAASGTCGRRICRPTSIPAGSRSRSATSRRATPAPSAMPPTPPLVAVDPEIGARRDPRLRGRRGRRHAGQPDDRRRPGLRRHRPGHRHRAVRGDAVRPSGPAAGLDLGRLPAARRDRGARDARSSTWRRPRPTPSSASEGHRRRRRHRAAGGDRQRGQRRARAARRRDLRVARSHRAGCSRPLPRRAGDAR